MPPDDLSRRDEFLIAMYAQLWQNINRHIMIVWEGVGVLVAVFAVFGLVSQGMPLSVASAVLLLACIWVMAHTYDSSHWYNRNLLMISNIERQFLGRKDLEEIHYFFEQHRPSQMITFLRIQWWLAAGLATIVIGYYSVADAIPRLTAEGQAALKDVIGPYVLLIVAALAAEWLRRKRDASYSTLLERSPGKQL